MALDPSARALGWRRNGINDTVMALAPRSISSRTALRRADASSSGGDHIAARIDALADAAGQFEVGERIGLLHDNPAGQRSGRLRPREMQDLLEVLRDQQADSGALGLQHDVGRHASVP